MTLTFAQAQDDIARLVKHFHTNRATYLSATYIERAARNEFIDPLFIALGWDVRNDQRAVPTYREVDLEESLEGERRKQSPDYTFRIFSDRKFLAEAKKPSVSIKSDPAPAYQLRSYGWNAKLPLSILTDFEELAIYNCRIKPSEYDQANVARVEYFTYEQYPDVWRKIWDAFSREAVVSRGYDEFAEQIKTRRGTLTVDDDFLDTIERWRKSLAQNIAPRNLSLTVTQLNDAVQRTIDRIIFLRIAEDRDIETYGQLKEMAQGESIYRRLLDLFKRANDKYNAGLFDFAADESDTRKLVVDDKVLKALIGDLYTDYNFKLIPVEILGNVYEQFLGKVIHLTPTHQARIEEKPAVRKAGGVYYTPAYIVDYIVRHTVGKLVEHKTPREISRLRVLDMACGSGSFLLGAYQFLLDWHLQWYVEHDPHKQPAVYDATRGTRAPAWQLTTTEKKRILLNNLYGVDIDKQAVEVTKLSLLLKVLADEQAENFAPQFAEMRVAHERVLPNLDANIKCGNSLIGTDYFAGRNHDEEELRRVNPFDWEREFPDVMKVGGFDCVIGNPPYVRQEILGEGFKTYAQKKYITYAGTADLYAYFIERGVSLLKRGGLFGFIVANKWMRANYGEPLRRWLKQQHIEEITDFGDLPVFKSATTYPCILIIRQDSPQAAFSATKVETLAFKNLDEYAQANRYTVNQMKLDDSGWSLSNESAQALLEKLRAVGIPLGEYVRGKIYRGILTGLNEAFIIDGDMRKQLIAEDAKSAELIKPFVVGREVKRYQAPTNERFLIFMPKGWTSETSQNVRNALGWLQNHYPAIAKHLALFANAAEKRLDKGEYWWELRACDYYDEFEKPKIIVPAIVQRASYIFDREGVYSNDKTSIIVTDDLYLLGILNSKVPDYVMHSISSTKQGGYFEYKPMYLTQLPIRPINFSDPADRARHDRMVSLVTQMLDLHQRLHAATSTSDRELLQRQIDATDKTIDELVYELYGLTEEEIGVVGQGT
jgi:type I restriction-modification system DNA methylase subunit